MNKKIISSSRYLQNGKINISVEDVPDELIEFVENSCLEYILNDIFVMDTALFEDNYKIVECNCFNGTGFYKHDITKIVKAMNAFLQENNKLITQK